MNYNTYTSIYFYIFKICLCGNIYMIEMFGYVGCTHTDLSIYSTPTYPSNAVMARDLPFKGLW